MGFRRIVGREIRGNTTQKKCLRPSQLMPLQRARYLLGLLRLGLLSRLLRRLLLLRRRRLRAGQALRDRLLHHLACPQLCGRHRAEVRATGAARRNSNRACLTALHTRPRGTVVSVATRASSSVKTIAKASRMRYPEPADSGFARRTLASGCVTDCAPCPRSFRARAPARVRRSVVECRTAVESREKKEARPHAASRRGSPCIPCLS